MTSYLNQLKNAALSLFFPPLCPICEKWNGAIDIGFCPECFKKLSFITAPVCRFCGEPMTFNFGETGTCMNCIKKQPVYTSARAAIVYNDVSRLMILRFKHGDATYNSTIFARMMVNAAHSFIKNADIIIPVPVHPWRLLKRKYNQAALLADKIAIITKKKSDNNNLIRIKNTPYQGSINGKDRHTNVKNVFIIKNPFTIADKNVILVDDVYTTGSTVSECASALFKNGAKTVNVLTLAKVINRNKNDNTGNTQL